jgi:hypothetical protein
LCRARINSSDNDLTGLWAGSDSDNAWILADDGDLRWICWNCAGAIAMVDGHRNRTRLSSGQDDRCRTHNQYRIWNYDWFRNHHRRRRRRRRNDNNWNRINRSGNRTDRNLDGWIAALTAEGIHRADGSHRHRVVRRRSRAPNLSRGCRRDVLVHET